MCASSLLAACVPATFSELSLFGAEVITINTALVTNFSATSLDLFRLTQPTVELRNATFCNITVSYTHPGQADYITVETWLPVDNWNHRLQALGGAGYVAGRADLTYTGMYGALADGYATVTTDAGVDTGGSSSSWALLSPGNVDLYSLQNLGSVSLDDEAKIAKSLIKSFYGKGPDYSYWNGCSAGGRQGLLLAQRYPDAYDGIIAAAPGTYWSNIGFSMQWPQQVMNTLGQYPYGCELDYIRQAAITACDGLDGVVDGIISKPSDCIDHFNPSELVGKSFSCPQRNNSTMEISEAAVEVTKATWNGRTTADGKKAWHGMGPPADLTGNDPDSLGFPALAVTNCSESGCVGAPMYVGSEWLRLFVAKNADLDLSKLEPAEFDRLAHVGYETYDSIIGTTDADLTAFRDAGGKMITYHGMADNLISIGATEQYYTTVKALDPTAADYYRYFEVPGMSHCFGGRSGQPTQLFSQLRAWVENGEAPEKSPIVVKGLQDEPQDRIICAYPKEPQFDQDCGNSADRDCWVCA